MGIRGREDGQLCGDGADLCRVSRPTWVVGEADRSCGCDRFWRRSTTTGLLRTAGLTKIIVVLVLATLTLVVTASLGGASYRHQFGRGIYWQVAGMASCNRPVYCSSPLPDMPGSPPWEKRYASPNAPSHGRS